MRKIGVVLLIIILWTSVSAYAEEDKVFDFDEYQLSIKFDESFYVFSNNYFDERAREIYGVTPSSMNDVLIQYGSEVIAYSNNELYEISVNIANDLSTDEVDFNSSSDYEIESIISNGGMKKEYENMGFKNVSSRLADVNEYLFMVTEFDYIIDNTSRKNEQWYTTFNGTGVGIVLTSYSDEITLEMRNKMDEVVKSLVYEGSLKSRDKSPMKRQTVFNYTLLILFFSFILANSISYFKKRIFISTFVLTLIGTYLFTIIIKNEDTIYITSFEGYFSYFFRILGSTFVLLIIFRIPFYIAKGFKYLFGRNNLDDHSVELNGSDVVKTNDK